MAGDRIAFHRWRAPLLFLAAFVLIAALASNLANLSEPLPELPQSTDQAPGAGGVLSGWLRDALVVGLAASGVAFLIVLYLWARKGTRKQAKPAWDLIAIALGIAALALLLVMWPSIGEALRDDASSTTGEDPNATSTGGSGFPSFFEDAPSQVMRATPLLALFFTVTSLAFALAVLSRRSTRRRTLKMETLPTLTPLQEIAAVVHRTIEELEVGLEPRESILRCYAALLGLLRRRGLSGLEPLTPREIEWRGLTQLGLHTGDIDALTTVFEEARYSDHPMGPEARDRALSAFRGVRASLET